MDSPAATWRKSSQSGSQSDCVEVSRVGNAGAIRDSKNRTGPILTGDLSALFDFLKADRLDAGSNEA